MSTPTISIIVPCYNCSNTIEKCLLSLLKSKKVNLHIILADDGSTDETGNICKHFAESFSNITYLALKHKGVSAARNAALQAASGEYIGFTDSDDYVEPEMFATLLEGFSTEGTLASVCGFVLEYPDHKIDYSYDTPLSVSYERFLSNIFTDPKTEGFLFNKLFSAKHLKNHLFDESLSVCEDLYYILGLNTPNNMKVSYCPGALYHYVQSENSLTGGRSFFNNDSFRYAPAFKKLLKIVKDRTLLKSVGQKYYKIIRDSMNIIMTTNDIHPIHTPEDKHEIKLIKKELRRSGKNGVFTGFTIKERLSYLKNAYLPTFILLKIYDRKHS